MNWTKWTGTLLPLLAAGLLLLPSCGQGGQDADNAAAAGLADLKTLGALLPTTVAGIPRTEAKTRMSVFSQAQIAVAEATYMDSATYGENTKKISVTITDTGGHKLALLGMAGWMGLGINEDSEDGTAMRNVRIGQYSGFESYNPRKKSGETSVVLADRFLVTVIGRRVSASEMYDAIIALNLDGIAKTR